MNTVLKIFLSMSFSGGLLILALLLVKRFLKDKISRQWQYYIWLIVILRLLLPFEPETNLLGKIYQAADRAITQAAPLPQQTSLDIPEGFRSAVDLEQDNENADRPAEDLTAVRPLQDMGSVLANHIWLIWLAVVLGMLIRKITVYQGFLQYINAGLVPVPDIGILDRLFITAQRAGIKKPIELCINPLISSPILVGFFHPCIVLPSADISEKDFQYIVLHELTHYKRRDMFYKWLVQVTVCLHWFNPLVHLMGREITKACEFSCDEAVLAKVGCDNAQDYGKTLLNAMAAVGKYKENPGAVTLSENKQLLKERLGAIVNFKKKSTAIWLLTGLLTLCVIFGASFIGVYPVAASSNQTADNFVASERNKNSAQGKQKEEWEKAQIAKYRAAGVAIDGKNYYYQGKLVHIFLDIMQPGQSFYTLDINPAGTVNIKIIRNTDNEITGVAYMTEAEAAELFEDEDGLDDEAGPEIIPVNLKKVAKKRIIWLGEYTLSKGDKICYNVSAKTGKGMQVGLAKPGDKRLNTTYYSVKNLRQKGEPLKCTADFTFGPPVKPGTYKLFLRATNGVLKNVKGNISVTVNTK